MLKCEYRKFARSSVTTASLPAVGSAKYFYVELDPAGDHELGLGLSGMALWVRNPSASSPGLGEEGGSLPSLSVKY